MKNWWNKRDEEGFTFIEWVAIVVLWVLIAVVMWFILAVNGCVETSKGGEIGQPAFGTGSVGIVEHNWGE